MPISQAIFDKFSEELLLEVDKMINDNYGAEMNTWLVSEAEIDFAQVYIERFRANYKGELDEQVDDRLEFLAKGLSYLIKTYVAINAELDKEKLLDYVNTYINTQLGNFDIDFDGLIHWLEDGEESDPC